MIIIIISLFVLHTIISLFVYCLFVSKVNYPQGVSLDNPPPEMDFGPGAVVVMKSRQSIPIPVLIYVTSGYAGLLVATGFVIYKHVKD